MTAAAQPTTLYSRHEHGGHRVHVHDHGSGGGRLYEVEWPSGPETYTSARSLLRALYSGGDGSTCARDPGISFKRYFRLGQVAPSPVDVLGLLGIPVPPTPRVAPARQARTRKGSRPRPAVRQAVVVEAPWWQTPLDLGEVATLEPAAWYQPEPEVVLGIDLENRGHEVRKLLFAGFGARMARYGYDPEDVLQEVYRGLLARNQGTCPWDIRKSSFGHYVHMVCSCVLNNYARKLRRRNEFEQLGLGALDRDGNWSQVDAAEVAVEDEASGSLEEPTAHKMALTSLGSALAESDRPEAVLAVRVLPLVAEGYQRGEIAAQIGVEPAKVGKALALIRGVTRTWAADQGLR